MRSDDMPSFHTIVAASGSNNLGFYMYHGGNNPHSLVYLDDAPNTTLQESSFQPAGPQNGMPSESYDFFAPLGEFGQPRQHYHDMRRFHLFLETFGSWMTEMVNTLPDQRPSGPQDTTTPRLAVRSNNYAGFLFVNNHQRQTIMPAKNFSAVITAADGSQLAIPFPGSTQTEVTINPGVWFHWPFNVPMTPTGVVNLTLATAQPVSVLQTGPSAQTWVFVATPGVPAQFVLNLGSNVQIASHQGTLRRQGASYVIENIANSSWSSPAVVIAGGPWTSISIVLLPESTRSQLWTATLDGQRHLLVSAATVLFVDNNTLHLRCETADACSALVYPPLVSCPAGGGGGGEKKKKKRKKF